MLDGIITAIGTFLIVVLILCFTYVTTKAIGKGTLLHRGASQIKILDRVAVGQNQALLIVAIGKRFFLIGTSSSSMSLLSELNEEELENIQEQQNTEGQQEAFQQILKKLGNRKR